MATAVAANDTSRGEAREASSLERAFTRLADGDRSAADEVFAALWPRLLRFCERAAPASEAQDCAQRAMMTLFEQAATFDPQRSLMAWALTLATWECRSAHRRKTRRREDPHEPESPGDTHTEELVESGLNPEQHTAERELIERALRMAGELSEVDQETLYFDLLGEGDASAKHRQRRHRMLNRLRSAWRALYGVE